MKKLSFGLVALLAIVFAVGSAFTTKDQSTKYHVYGVQEELPILEQEDWENYIPEVPEMLELFENPITFEVGPFDEPQELIDFDELCDTDPDRVCLVQVKKQDNVIVEVEAIYPGLFEQP